MMTRSGIHAGTLLVRRSEPARTPCSGWKAGVCLGIALPTIGLVGSCRCPEQPDTLIERVYVVTAREAPDMQGAIVTVIGDQIIVEYDRPNGHSYQVIWDVVGREQP